MLLLRRIFLIDTFSDEIRRSRPSFEMATRLFFLFPFCQRKNSKVRFSFHILQEDVTFKQQRMIQTLTAETLITSIPFPKTPPAVPLLLPEVCAIFNCTGSENVSKVSLVLDGRPSSAVCPPNALETMVADCTLQM